MPPDWWPSWEGEPCVIVASGPSASGVPLERAKGRARFVAINSSWRLCPWADALYAADFRWWDHVAGCPEFDGLKLTESDRAVEAGWGAQKVTVMRQDDRLHLSLSGTVGWGGSSGFQAFNLAVQFGCNPIVLVGFDASLKHGAHWHGRHPEGLSNPKPHSVDRWRKAMDNAARFVSGIEVFNCSPTSTLTRYRKARFEELFP